MIEILSFQPEFAEHIKTLNYEWLENYFRIEEGDVLSLSDPKQYIIDKGGFIFFAKFENQVVGTASLLKKNESEFELGKMAVTTDMQGKGIGRKLLEHCLLFAKKNQIRSLVLYTNTQLQSAIYLYREYGFQEIELESGLYERANLKMRLDLSTIKL